MTTTLHTTAELDADLTRAVRHSSTTRRVFYAVVLLVALAGQVSGAVEALGIPWYLALPAVGALELGGIVVLANADVRRRLGERATGSRLLSAAVAAGAVAFNWLAHADHLMGGFFAGMSALGYLVWLTHTENQRRDRLRATGDLPPTTPAYELVGHWLRHPGLTMRARSLAKADPALGLYGSLEAARTLVRTSRRNTAISKVLHRKIRSAVDPTTADIAVAVYDLDQIADRLAGSADYDGLTDLIGTDLVPTRLAGASTDAAIAAAEVEQARAAVAEAVVWAEAAGGHAEAEASRRQQVEADLAMVRAHAEEQAERLAAAETAAERARADAETLAAQVAAAGERGGQVVRQWEQRLADVEAVTERVRAVLAEERHRREAAEARTERQAEEYTALVAEAEELRQRLAKAAAATPRKSATKRQPSAAEQVAKAITRSPTATDATIAARLGLSEATVRRHRRQAVDSVSTPTATSALKVA